MPQIAGALVSPNQGGATNWQSPSFSPQTGLFYVSAARAFSIYYIYDPEREPDGLGRLRSRRLVGVDDPGDRLQDRQDPLDATSGKATPAAPASSAPPATCCSPAVRRTISSRSNATTGDALWHSILNGSISNGPITYELDGRQYVVAAAGDTLWTFVLNAPPGNDGALSQQLPTSKSQVPRHSQLHKSQRLFRAPELQCVTSWRFGSAVGIWDLEPGI